jgi:microsomal dipeptidase-like Zn-dependent dipeptidase
MKNDNDRMDWSTNNILSILQRDLPEYRFEVKAAEGEIDSESIYVYSKTGTRIIVFGFDYDNIGIPDPSDCEVDIISVVMNPSQGISYRLPSIEEITMIHQITDALKKEHYEISHVGWEDYF